MRRSAPGSRSRSPVTPTCCVLDEPTAAMDVAARRQFWTAIRAYAADGHTVLFSTHQLHEADDVRRPDRGARQPAAWWPTGRAAQIRALAGVRDSVGQAGCRRSSP